MATAMPVNRMGVAETSTSSSRNWEVSGVRKKLM